MTTTLSPAEAYARYVGKMSPLAFVQPHCYDIDAAVGALLADPWWGLQGDDTPDDLGELLEAHLEASLPCHAQRWAVRAGQYEQEGFEYLSVWAEEVIGLGVRSTDGEVLTFWDGSRLRADLCGVLVSAPGSNLWEAA